MEFNEKLQQLRKQNNLTQEQLAEKLYVSRTAISKWESGKGYPNIESLKSISKLFSVSIDDLLSGEELINLAETENKSNLKKIYHFMSCIIDMMAVAYIILPLYGKPEGDYVYAVNLLSFTEQTKINIIIYWSVFLAMIGIGVVRLVLTKLDKDTWSGIATKCSMILGGFAVCFFATAKEPYATTLLFLFFIMKMLLWMKTRETL